MKNRKEISAPLAVLRQYCQDEHEVEHYCRILSGCDTAQEIANKVVKPLLIARHVKETDAKSEVFYMALARLADPDGTRIKRNTLYDNVRRVIKEIDRERRSEEMRYQVGKYSNGCDIRMLVRPDGFVEVTAHLQFVTMDTRLLESLMPALEYLQANFRTVVEKHFDARANNPVPVYDVECELEDMPILIRYMRDLTGDTDFRVTYFSSDTVQERISLDEALEVATSEADERDDR